MLLCSACPLTTYRPLPCISAVGLRHQPSTRVLGRADEGTRSSRSPSPPPLPAADTSILGEWMEVPDLTPEPGDSAAGGRDASEHGLADGAEEAAVEESARELPSWSHSLRPTRSLTPLTDSPCHLCPVPVRVIMRAVPFPPPPALPTVCRTTAVGAVASHKGKLLDRGTHEYRGSGCNVGQTGRSIASEDLHVLAPTDWHGAVDRMLREQAEEARQQADEERLEAAAEQARDAVPRSAVLQASLGAQDALMPASPVTGLCTWPCAAHLLLFKVQSWAAWCPSAVATVRRQAREALACTKGPVSTHLCQQAGQIQSAPFLTAHTRMQPEAG